MKIFISLFLWAVFQTHVFASDVHDVSVFLNLTETETSFKDALHSFSSYRADMIREEIRNSLAELSINHGLELKGKWALYALGSLSTDTTLPCSDFEFGILCDHTFLQNRVFSNHFLALLKSKLHDRGIDFDKNGWTPNFITQGVEYGNSILFSTPSQLFDTMRQSRKPTLRYTLHFTKFLFGDPLVYAEFQQSRLQLGSQWRLFSYELDATRRRISYIFFLTGYVDYALGLSAKEKKPYPFNFKPHLIKPFIELLNYLSFICTLPLGNPFEEIEKLVLQGSLTSELGQIISDTLEFGMKHRSIWGKEDFPLTAFSSEDLFLLKQGWEALLLLNEITIKRFNSRNSL